MDKRDILMVKIVPEDQKLTVDVQASGGTLAMLGMIGRARIALDEIEQAVKDNLKQDPKVKRS